METIKTVLFGFVGIRRKADHEKAQLNPVHVVIAAVVLVAVFIVTLLTIVKIVLS